MGQLHKAERITEGSHFIGQVVGIDRDAVASDARARVEGLKAERLGLGGLNRFPQIDPEVVAEDRHLVYQSDVDVPVGVLQELRHLGFARASYWHDGVNESFVHLARPIGGRLVVATDNLGSILDPVGCVARVDPFGRVREKEILTCSESGRLQQRTHNIVGGSRVGRRFEYHELTRAQLLSDTAAGALHGSKVGATGVVKGCRDTNHNGICVAEHSRICARLEPIGPHRADVFVRKIVDMAPTCVQALHDCVVEIESCDTNTAAHGLTS